MIYKWGWRLPAFNICCFGNEHRAAAAAARAALCFLIPFKFWKVYRPEWTEWREEMNEGSEHDMPCHAMPLIIKQNNYKTLAMLCVYALYILLLAFSVATRKTHAKWKHFNFYRIFNRWFWIRVIYIWLSVNWIGVLEGKTEACNGRWSTFFQPLFWSSKFKITVKWYFNLIQRFHFVFAFWLRQHSRDYEIINWLIYYLWRNKREAGATQTIHFSRTLCFKANSNAAAKL